MTEAPQKWYEYDYAIIRIVPRVQIGMFFNVGVVLHSRTAGFLDARFRVDRERIENLCPEKLDLDLLEHHLEAYLQICKGGPELGVIGLLPASERFHWLTAPRSAVLQTSEVHPGRTHSPADCLETLFSRLVP